MKECIKGLEKKKLEMKAKGKRKEEGIVRKDKEEKGIGESIRELERKLKMKEREERRRNVVIRSVEVREEKRETVKEALGV